MSGDWVERAACIAADNTVFFPTRSGNSNTAEALRICRTCVVATECLDHALTAPEQFGVWGGTTQWERRDMAPARKRPRPPRCGTEAAYARHRRLGEQPCGACMEANTRQHRLRYLKRHRPAS